MLECLVPPGTGPAWMLNLAGDPRLNHQIRMDTGCSLRGGENSILPLKIKIREIVIIQPALRL
jgi:hypothetical protein